MRIWLLNGGREEKDSFFLSLSLPFSQTHTPRWSVFSTPFEQSRVGHSRFLSCANSHSARRLSASLFFKIIPADCARAMTLDYPSLPRTGTPLSIHRASRGALRIRLDCSAYMHISLLLRSNFVRAISPILRTLVSFYF